MFRAIFFIFIVIIACIAATALVRAGPFEISADAGRRATALIWLAGLAAVAAGLVRRGLRHRPQPDSSDD